MKNIFLFNGGKCFVYFDGCFNQILYEIVLVYLDCCGFDLCQIFIDGGYDILMEVDKFFWVDVVIYQMFGWWMGVLWIVKCYIDEVFMVGYGSFYVNDGCICFDSMQKYGSGGLVQGKCYMILVIWNVLWQVFDDLSDFFEGKGVDVVYFFFYKVNQFFGMFGLLMFFVVDVMKCLDVLVIVVVYQVYLDRVFGCVG